MRENRRVYIKKARYDNVFYCRFPKWTVQIPIHINFKLLYPLTYSSTCTIQFRISPWFDSYMTKLVNAYCKQKKPKNPLLNLIINLKVFYVGKNFIMPK